MFGSLQAVRGIQRRRKGRPRGTGKTLGPPLAATDTQEKPFECQ